MSWSAHHITYTYPHDHRIIYTLITSYHTFILTISASYIRSLHYIIHLSSRPAHYIYAHHIPPYTYPHDKRITYTLFISYYTLIFTTSASHYIIYLSSQPAHYIYAHHITSYTYPYDQRITYTLITLHHTLILMTSASHIRSSHPTIHLSSRPAKP